MSHYYRQIILALLAAIGTGCASVAPVQSYTMADITFIRNTLQVFTVPIRAKRIEHFSVDPSLPEGLSLEGRSGVISGFPREVQTARTYVVRARAVSGETIRTTLRIRIESRDETNADLWAKN